MNIETENRMREYLRAQKKLKNRNISYARGI